MKLRLSKRSIDDATYQGFKEESREHYLSESELQRLGAVLSRIEFERSGLPQTVGSIPQKALGTSPTTILGPEELFCNKWTNFHNIRDTRWPL